VPPNSTRLLSNLGLDPYLKEYTTEPETISLRRWQTGHVIGLTQIIPNIQRTFGTPYYVIHRANYQSALYRRALDVGVKIKLASRVIDYDTQGPSIVLEDGVVVSAHLVVAADGTDLHFDHEIGY
jgi:salicylate hydroxylase